MGIVPGFLVGSTPVAMVVGCIRAVTSNGYEISSVFVRSQSIVPNSLFRSFVKWAIGLCLMFFNFDLSQCLGIFNLFASVNSSLWCGAWEVGRGKWEIGNGA